MHYHVILTKKCNLNCTYCGGGSDTEPFEIQYSISDLKTFLLQDSSPVIEFYGGEPLLRIEKMKGFMDEIDAKFVIQTNGVFLDKIEEKELKKFHSILVSIDGDEETTDANRQSGIYKKVLKNIRVIREKGFNGDLVARMTIPQGSDIYKNVTHLAMLDFDHVHWQLGFEIFWESGIPDEGELEKWINSYNKGITSLVKWWVMNMEKKKRVYGLVPFISIMNSLLDNTPTKLRCGSGIDFFTIMPDGRISACPVSVDFDFSIAGSIYQDSPISLYNKVGIIEPCISCEIYTICGGRCLFVNRSQEMLRKDGYELICITVKHLINELKNVLFEIRKFIEKGYIKRQEFKYPEINNGCEIIP